MSDIMNRDVDRGWAWVALLASVCTLSILAAFDTSHGIFQLEVKQVFPGNQGLVALIFSLALGGRFLFGPLSGVISDLVTHRVAVMVGGALLCLGMVTASFMTSLPSLLFFLGICCGTGSGLAFTASVTVLSTYFNKYRTLAFGISLAAPGIGLIGAPYLLRWLIVDYGWRFAMACFAGVMAQICFLGSMYLNRRPCISCCPRDRKPAHGDDPETEVLNAVEEKNKKEQGHLLDDSSREESVHLLVELPTPLQESAKILPSESCAENGSSAKKTDNTTLSTSPGHRSLDQTALQSFWQRIRSLLCQKFLWVMDLNQMMINAGYVISLNFFPGYAQSVGVSLEDLPTLYTLYGITLMVTRVSSGFILNRVPSHFMLKALFFVGLGFGLVQLFLPLYGVSFQALLVERLLTGIMYGSSLVLVTPILDHYLGAQNLPVAFGIVMLCSGVGSVTFPPIAGALYDVYGTYNVCCYLSGSVGVASALSLLFTLCLNTRP